MESSSIRCYTASFSNSTARIANPFSTSVISHLDPLVMTLTDATVGVQDSIQSLSSIYNSKYAARFITFLPAIYNLTFI